MIDSRENIQAFIKKKKTFKKNSLLLQLISFLIWMSESE